MRTASGRGRVAGGRIRRPERTDPGLPVAPEDVERFLAGQAAKGRAAGTIGRYRSSLEHLYRFLPEGDKCIRPGTLSQWRDALLEGGFSPSSVNVSLAACDGFLEFMGRKEYRLENRLTLEDKVQPELTRSEYLRLLQTAKLLGKERVYLVVKVFGTTGLRIQDVQKLTVEAVREGKLTAHSGGGRQIVRIPECLRRELLGYIGRTGAHSGPVFVTRKGRPVNRSGIAVEIQRLGEAARIPEGKANPRALRKLCLQTRSNVESNLELLIEQALDRQLEQEQLNAGWES